MNSTPSPKEEMVPRSSASPLHHLTIEDSFVDALGKMGLSNLMISFVPGFSATSVSKHIPSLLKLFI